MKTRDIYAGIYKAKTPEQLSAHFDNIEDAIERGECDYDAMEGLSIELAAREHVTNKFRTIFH